jgi:uncharacterized protein YecE (DUF72 family)
MRIHVGTSGWSYAHWKSLFYPADLPEAQWLAFYAARFHTVEINNSFYRLPDPRTLASWVKTVPKQFEFTVKASRFITHMKKLKDPKRSTRTFFRRISGLGDHLGPILFQLPPRWRFDARRLEGFLRVLSRDFRYAFEFRDRSWINEEALELLARSKAAFCIYDLDDYLSPKNVTTDFVYVRLHGPDGPFRGSYDARTLAGWARHFTGWADQRRKVYCYFDNDERAYAAENAARLQDMIAA